MGLLARITAGAALVASAAVAAPGAHALGIEEVTSPEGKTFWLVNEPQIPMVSLQISFEGGARLDPEGKGGLSRFVMGLLDEGAGDLDATAFAEAKDEAAARFSFSTGRDGASVSASMLTETLDRSADLLAMALAEPRFDAPAVERVRAQILSGIASDMTDPGEIASRAWFARAFGDHPYGAPTDGTVESVAALTAEDLRAQHARLLTRDAAVVAVVGDVDAERAGRLVDRVLGGLPEGGDRELSAPPETPPGGLAIEELDVPQSVALFGHRGLARDDPDFIPAFVMNWTFGGGGFSSRLMTEVREKRGLAYGVYTYLADLDGAPLYIGRVQTANERIGESLEVIRAEWERMASEGMTEEELDKAKRYLTGAFPLQFDSNAKIARFLVGAQEDDLGIDYINIRNDLIEAVTLEDIRRVSARLLKPEELSVVVVGRPAGL